MSARLHSGGVPDAVTVLCGFCAGLSVLAFMTVGARGDWTYVLAFRGEKLAGLLLVAYSIAVSTVLFQTISENRVLTPSVIGFDALYSLLQTGLVFLLGASGATGLDPRLQFVVETIAMIVFSLLLFRWLFSGAARSLHLLMLVGLILGGVFRSLSSFLQRVLDPNDFVVLQDRLFASFNSIDGTLLGIATFAILIVTSVLWRIGHSFDILALGRERAIGLGVDHHRTTTLILIMIAVLVSVSTALVGPVTFFGLLVASLAREIAPSNRHAVVLPIAVCLAVTVLIAGQVILERLFSFSMALGIIIEFVGGLAFILLVVRGAVR